MTSIAFEDWDAGSLRVNREFAPILRANRLDTFAALMNHSGGTIAKNLLAERTTTRITLQAGDDERAFFIKRHTPSPLIEYIKPLFRLTWPILGAVNEWNALLQFHTAGIPSMVPVALGRSGRRSFLVTEAIEGYVKLSDWLGQSPSHATIATVIEQAADLAQKMHAAGLHHQDFYTGHLLLREQSGSMELRVIDLGRARGVDKLSARWIIKDLAQFDYSARQLPAPQRMRFLKAYLGRRHRLDRAERRFVQSVLAKSRRIARHSQKNRL